MKKLTVTTKKPFPTIKVIIIALAISGVISSTVISCNNDISNFFSNKKNSNNTSTGTTDTDETTKQEEIKNNSGRAPSQNFADDNPTENILILGVKKDTNTTTLASLLNATILDTIHIGDETYIKIEGENLSIENTENLAMVKFAEKELIRHTFASPDDTYYRFQYAPQITNLEGVWENYTGAGVKVAVIDTGVNTLHEDFGGKTAFAEGHDFKTKFTYTTTTHNDVNGHGTHVAGIIAARKNNGLGIAGVAPDAIIIPYMASNDEGFFKSSDIASAIQKATDAGADVINMSLGGLGFSYIEQDAIRYAISRDVSVVVAAGNNTYSYRIFPASYAGVIAVASSNIRDKVSSYSTKNSYLSVAGPGEDILSLNAGAVGEPSTSYVSKSGTSMSAPYVAGVVALLKQKFPDATPAQIKSILESTALDIDAPGFDVASGHGRVQPDKALAVTTLPTISWAEVEFTLTLNFNTNIESQTINIYDSSNTLISYLYTGTGGKASAYLPTGTYSYVSNYYGATATEGFTVVGTTKISLSHNFSTNDFDRSYRYLYTFLPWGSASNDKVDTALALYTYDSSGNSTLLATHDDISTATNNSNLYSKLLFKYDSTKKYRVYVYSPSTDHPVGRYMIKLDRNLLSRTETDRYTADETNDNAATREDLRLTVGQARSGYLNENDLDTFIF